MTIGKLAQSTGASVRSLRHYESKGLLQALRTRNRYREFTPSSVGQVRNIRRLLALGFTLDEIATFPACMLDADAAGLCPIAMVAHERRLREIEEQIAALEQQREKLRDALRANLNLEATHP